MKRKLEEFLSEAELADPDLAGFWLDDDDDEDAKRADE